MNEPPTWASPVLEETREHLGGASTRSALVAREAGSVLHLRALEAGALSSLAASAEKHTAPAHGAGASAGTSEMRSVAA